jgi:hypothetical protein
LKNKNLFVKDYKYILFDLSFDDDKIKFLNQFIIIFDLKEFSDEIKKNLNFLFSFFVNSI